MTVVQINDVVRHTISRDVYQSVARYIRPDRPKRHRTRREYLAERYLLCCFRTVGSSSSTEGLAEKVHSSQQGTSIDQQTTRNQAHLEEQFHHFYNTHERRKGAQPHCMIMMMDGHCDLFRYAERIRSRLGSLLGHQPFNR